MSARKVTLKRVDTPPLKERLPWLHVIRPGPAQRMIVLDARIRGFHTHWNAALQRTVECTNPVELCKGHALKLPLRYKGILSVLRAFHTTVDLLDLPEETAYQLHTMIGEESLRLKVISLQRENKNIRSRLFVEIVGEADPDKVYPMPLDPEPTLRKMWGIT